MFFAVTAALAAEAGDTDRAERALAVVGRGRLHHVLPTSSWLVTMFSLVDAAVSLRDDALAREVYELLEPYADLPVMASLGIACFGSASRSLGLAAHVMGRLDDAVAHLERAVAHDLRLGNRPMTAITCADLAETLLRRDAPGDRERAAGLVDKAIEAADRLELDGRLARWRRLRGTISERPAVPATPATCTRTGDTWNSRRRGAGARPAHRRHDLPRDIARVPGAEIAAGALAGVDVVAGKQDLLDDEARRALRRRVDELEDRIDAASLRGDDERVTTLQRELGALLAHARRGRGARRPAAPLRRCRRTGAHVGAEGHPVRSCVSRVTRRGSATRWARRCTPATSAATSRRGTPPRTGS